MCQSNRELSLPKDKTAKVLRLPNSNAQFSICFVPGPRPSLEKTLGAFPSRTWRRFTHARPIATTEVSCPTMDWRALTHQERP